VLFLSCQIQVSVTVPRKYKLNAQSVKMADVIDTCMKHRVVIEFLTAEMVSPIEVCRCLNSVYVEHTVDMSIVRCWVKVMASVFWDKEGSCLWTSWGRVQKSTQERKL
jgi:hypothetical protein